MSNEKAVARPYAKAAFNVALDTNALEIWSHFLQAASIVIKNAQVKPLLSNPNVSGEWLISLITTIAKGAGEPAGVQAFLELLVEKKRLAILPFVCDFFEQYRAQVSKRQPAILRTATPLDEAMVTRLEAALSKRLNVDIDMTCEVDERLIGGAVIQVNDTVIDGSVQGKLNTLAHALVDK